MQTKWAPRFLRLGRVALLLLGILALPQRTVHAAPNTLVNGGFEQGQGVGWQETSTAAFDIVIEAPAGVPAHSGDWMAVFGPRSSLTASISQTVTIAPNSTLVFWYRIIGTESCGASVAQVRFNAAILQSWALCFANYTPDWMRIELDLSEYAGQTGPIQFYVNTTAGNSDILLVDDVFLYSAFGDVPSDHPFLPFINGLYSAGITSGCTTSPLMYCPDQPVTRAQMAVFLLRGIHGSSYNPPAVGGSTGFTDVPPTYWAAAWIKQLAAEGITSGCGSGNFCPESSVTRAEMAVFLLRSKYGAAYNPPAVGAGTGFGDVPTTYWAAAWIKQLVAEGITSGCGAGTYCPESPVTRGQMAVFIVRAFGLPVP
jgi:hypothetical protein